MPPRAPGGEHEHMTISRRPETPCPVRPDTVTAVGTGRFGAVLDRIAKETAALAERGRPAGSIPLLADADPGRFGMAVAEPDGTVHGVGDWRTPFSAPLLDQRRVADLAQPFRRLGADRTGTGRGSGLGLSIVAAITRAHHGTLDLRARPDGGLRVTVTLPRTDGRTTTEAHGTETGVRC